MEKEYINRYYLLVRDFSKKYELLNQGVLELALEENKELYEKVTHLEEDNYRFKESEVVTLVTRYNQLNKVYKKRFNLIFTRCLDYSPLEGTLNMYLGGVKFWTKSILSLSEELFLELDKKTESLNTTLASKEYSKYIKLDNGKSLDDLIEDCSRNFY